MKCDFQQEEKAKLNSIHASKLNEKRSNVINTSVKIQINDQENFAKSTGILLRKGCAQDTHEKTSHIVGLSDNFL
jgi:hypothetical protein